MIETRNGRTIERQTVRLYGRKFVVKKEAATGEARAILERKERSDGAIRDETYWHCSQRLPGKDRAGRSCSVVRRVLDEAGADYSHLMNERIAA
jgi:hypothetical protein